MMRKAVIFAGLLGLTGCDAISQHDVGADMAACQVSEMQTPRHERSQMERDLRALPDGTHPDNIRELVNRLAREKLDFLSTCMRAKGWKVKLDVEADCIPKGLDAERCYVR